MNEVQINSGERGLALRSLDDMVRFADIVIKAGLAPKGMNASAVVIAIQFGSEAGLTPMQALSSVGVINGKPALYGDGALAVCQGHPKWGGMEERIEGEGDNRTALCVVKRKGEPDTIRQFSVKDAKKAALWGKAGPWTTYPDRMQLFRARGFALRDAYADALRGLITEAEAQDYPVPTKCTVVEPKKLREIKEEEPEEAPPEVVQGTIISTPEIAEELERESLIDLKLRPLCKECVKRGWIVKKYIAADPHKLPVSVIRRIVARIEADIFKADAEQTSTPNNVGEQSGV
jgi:hypothetical protein